MLQDAKEIVDLERAVLGQVCAVHGVVDLVLAEARAEGVGLQVRGDLGVVGAAELTQREHGVLLHEHLVRVKDEG